MDEPEFWRMREPDYRSDYQASYVNGTLEHPFGLPGVRCEICGVTWSGSRVLPVPCPAPLRDRPELRHRWPIPGASHRALRHEVAEHLERAGHGRDRLLPGDDFQPCYLDVPSRPRADFLWASLGSVVVSDRIRQGFSDLAPDRIAFAPVTLRKVGKREATLPPPVAASGEPEDMLEELERLATHEGVGPYHEMIVHAESGLPRGISHLNVCEGCGRPSYDEAAREIAMHPEMWRGAPVFLLATTLWIIVTDEVRQVLQRMKATNVRFVPPTQRQAS